MQSFQTTPLITHAILFSVYAQQNNFLHLVCKKLVFEKEFKLKPKENRNSFLTEQITEQIVLLIQNRNNKTETQCEKK